MPGDFLSNGHTSQARVEKGGKPAPVTKREAQGSFSLPGTSMAGLPLSADGLFLSRLSELLRFVCFVPESATSAAGNCTLDYSVLFKKLAAVTVGHVCYDLAAQDNLMCDGVDSNSGANSQLYFSRGELIRILVLSFGQGLSTSQRNAIIARLNVNGPHKTVTQLQNSNQYFLLLRIVHSLRSYSNPGAPDSKYMHAVENTADLLAKMVDSEEQIEATDATGKQIKTLEAMLLLHSVAYMGMVAAGTKEMGVEHWKHCLTFVKDVLHYEKKLFDALVIPVVQEEIKRGKIQKGREVLRGEAQSLLYEIRSRTMENRSSSQERYEPAHTTDTALRGNEIDRGNVGDALKNCDTVLNHRGDGVVVGVHRVLDQVKHLAVCIGRSEGVRKNVSNLQRCNNSSEEIRERTISSEAVAKARRDGSASVAHVGICSLMEIVWNVYDLLGQGSVDNSVLPTLARRVCAAEKVHGSAVISTNDAAPLRIYSVVHAIEGLLRDIRSATNNGTLEQHLGVCLRSDVHGILEYLSTCHVTYRTQRNVVCNMRNLLYSILMNLAVGCTAIEDDNSRVVNSRVLVLFTYVFGSLPRAAMEKALEKLKGAFQERGKSLQSQIDRMLCVLLDLNEAICNCAGGDSHYEGLHGVEDNVDTIAKMVAASCVSEAEVGSGISGPTRRRSATVHVDLLDSVWVLLLESVAMWKTSVSLMHDTYISGLVTKDYESRALEASKLALELKKELCSHVPCEGSDSEKRQGYVQKITDAIEKSMKVTHDFLERYSGQGIRIDACAQRFGSGAHESFDNIVKSTSMSQKEFLKNFLRFMLYRSLGSLRHAKDIVGGLYSQKERPASGRAPSYILSEYPSCTTTEHQSYKSECFVHISGNAGIEKSETTSIPPESPVFKNRNTSLNAVQVSRVEIQVPCTAMDHA
ncbi:MAG: hypothetical protein AB8U44_02500 [Aaplasma endosymbiont of Hyalomma asiaticum]